jgi:25S rRNA (cytosine2278-C5)-methyltransferase
LLKRPPPPPPPAPEIQNKNTKNPLKKPKTTTDLPALRAAVRREGLVERHSPYLGEALACVLAYEALLGQGLPGGSGGSGVDGGAAATKQQNRHRAGPAEDAVRQALPGLRRAMSDLQREAGASSILDLAARLGGGGAAAGAGGGRGAAAAASAAAAGGGADHQDHPPHWRTARVNTLKLPSVEHALARLGQKLASKALRDPLLPELLLFPPGTDLHDHAMVRRGELVLQGRSSCLPARALLCGGGGGGGDSGGAAGWTCLDACAAPGNKTTHLAALVTGAPGGGRVLAFDRDPRRLELLRASVERAGASAVVACRRADFLALDPSAAEFRGVRAVLLDPSCSGSGTAAARQLAGGGLLLAEEEAAEEEEEEQQGEGGEGSGGGQGGAAESRVEQLARFQAAALKQALRFPAAERVAYSTCSVHARENEAVVAEVLADAEVQAAGWRLADPFPAIDESRGAAAAEGGAEEEEQERDAAAVRVAPMYGRRGWSHPRLASGLERLLVRCDAALDGTDGFFVALFVRSRGGAVGGGGKKKKIHEDRGR